VKVATEIVADDRDKDVRLVSEVFDGEKSVGRVESRPAGGKPRVEQTLKVEQPKLWSPQTPNLYRLVQRLYRGEMMADEVTIAFGFRSVRFDANTGFWLNGANIKLKGVGMHYDASPVGVAIPDEVLEARLLRLKEMGCNSIRTGHTPFPPHFYDLCDRLGLMVMNEAFDGWRKKVEFDYGATAFGEWWKRDLSDFVRRDRNHPSVIMWSIGNETGHSDRLGMTQVIAALDPTRTTTGGQCLEGVGVAGFNGPGEVPGVLEGFHREHPQTPIVLTEQTHAYQTRGFYRVVSNFREGDRSRTTDFEPYGTSEIFHDGDEQFRSSYDNAPVRITSRQCWKRTRDTPWISGEFRWAGFDYLGEAHWGGRHWPARHWHPGIHDTSGLPKDTAYFYQSQWTSEPMVHLLPHWTHPELARGAVVPVVAYSNCEEVELFLNGKSQSRKRPRVELLDFLWQVPYEAGEIKAIGYRGGEPVASKMFRTATTPSMIKLETKNEPLKADRRDVATVTFSIRDERDELVPWAMDRVEFRLEGPARLLGYENGNPIDVTPNRVPYRNAFYGLGRGFFAATDQDGAIELTAAGILGSRNFDNQASVAMAVQRIALRGALKPAEFTIHYTLDGSDPTASSPRYDKPIFIAQAREVRMLLVRDGQPYLTSRAAFVRGAPATSQPVATQPSFETRPRDEQLVGIWREGQREFRLAPDGRVLRRQGDTEREVARWWYDFPDDVFEDEQAAGSGQIRWSDGKEVVDVRLAGRDGKTLRITSNSKSRQWRRQSAGP
jgi:beta-galactosidase